MLNARTSLLDVSMRRGTGAIMKTATKLSSDAKRSAVDRVLASSDFKASIRIRRFLNYIVQENLAGRSGRIKAYEIATTVLGREVDFDPQIDPIVRVEARRLRAALDRYYLTAGKKDPVRISVPKGAYVAKFELTESPPEFSAPLPATIESLPEFDHRWPPSLFVAPFVLEGDIDRFPDFGQGLTRQVIVALTRFCDLHVYGSETSFRFEAPGAAKDIQSELDFDFCVSGGVEIAPGNFAVGALLTDTNTGQVLWADRFETALNPSGILKWREQVAEKVARIIAQPYGVIFSKRAQEVEGKQADQLTSYDCVNRYYHYSRSLSRAGNAEVTDCLEQTIARDPQYSEAFACLSQSYSDAYRCGFPIEDSAGDPLGRALTLALKSIELAPRSSLGFHALGQAYWFQNDVNAALEAFETGLALNPNATALMAELGQKLAILADWERAVPLLEKSFARNPAQPGTFRIGLASYHFSEGRFQQGLSEARRIGTPDLVYPHIMEAISLVRLGLTDDAKAAVARILDLRPDYGLVVREDLKLRNVEPKLADDIVQALQDAGLETNVRRPEPVRLRLHTNKPQP